MINDKVAIVAGPTRVLYFQISSREFAQWASAIIVCSRNIASAEKSDRVIQAHSDRLYITNPGSVPESARHKAEMQKSSDILINNVGYHFDCNMRNKRFHKAVEEDFQGFVDVDLKGTFMVLQDAMAVNIVSEAFTSATYNMVVTYGGKVLP